MKEKIINIINKHNYTINIWANEFIECGQGNTTIIFMYSDLKILKERVIHHFNRRDKNIY